MQLNYSLIGCLFSERSAGEARQASPKRSSYVSNNVLNQHQPMKKLFLLLPPLILLYAAWFYWQGLGDRPLREQLLSLHTDEVTEVTITPPAGESVLTLTRAENGWVVARGPRQILGESVRVEQLIDRLTTLQTDSVSRRKTVTRGYKVQLRTADDRVENLFLAHPARETPLAQIPATGDVYHLPPEAARYIFPALRFDHYREARLLHLLPGQVDSIVASRNDSTLWVEAEVLSPLYQRLLAPAAAPFADYFDEIAHRDRYHADLDFYFSGKAHRVQVFRDSLWPQPYVLVGADFPRRFIAFDRIR